MFSTVVIAVIGAFAAANVLLALCYLRDLKRLWREPVLKHPVLIIESDDWGPGPEEHAGLLLRLTDLLQQYRDAAGRRPVMTLGLALALPDGKRIKDDGFRRHHRITLADERFSSVREAMLHGVEQGVFSLQLHGMEHYWPESVMKAATVNEEVRQWLLADANPSTEALPPSLQSRWVDAASLPSTPLGKGECQQAASEEAKAFMDILGEKPAVAVPPTFVWNPAVEQGWKTAGVDVVVTPGRRYGGRGGNGELLSASGPILCGDHSTCGQLYLVRDDYFEPALGHTAETALLALENKTRMGRPTLVETHRFNFTGNAAKAETSFSTLADVLEKAIRQYPDLCFMATEELARKIKAGDASLVMSHGAMRVQKVLARVQRMPRFWRLARMTGAAFFAGICLKLLVTKAAAREMP